MQGNENPRIGLIILRTDWIERPEAREAYEPVQNDAQEIVNRLKRQFDVHGVWVIESLDSLTVHQHALRDADVDLVLLLYQTWAEDTRLVTLLQAIAGRPLVLWCYLPWRRMPQPASFHEVLRVTGPVGTLGALGTLRNLNVPFLFTYGAPDDPKLMQDLQVASRAAQVRTGLRNARFGMLPSRNEQMQSNFVDEFRLMADFGPVVQYLSVSEFRRMVDALPRNQVEEYLQQVKRCFRVKEVSEETLTRAAEATLGLAQLAAEYRLDVLAVNDISPELHRAFGLRPALYPDLLNSGSTLFQPEGDLGAATANYILSKLTGSPTLFLEIWYWDEAMNRLVGGHAGVQNPALGEPKQIWISPDYEFCMTNPTEGAQIQLIARPGRVTLFQLRSTPRGWQAITASAMCLGGEPLVEGYPHAVLRLDAQVDHFLRSLATLGCTQHWVMAYGSVIHELEAFCSMMNIPLEVLA